VVETTTFDPSVSLDVWDVFCASQNIVSLELLAQGKTHGSTLQQCTNKALTIIPFDNTYEENEVSPEVEEGVVARLKCMQP
jgi:hypothetical protein